MNTTAQLQIYLFGQFRLLRNGIEVSSRDWHTRQARQLFKVLLQERGRLVPAHKLIDLLWPENVENAHKALRSAVSALRDVLEPVREPWLPSSFVPRGQDGYALVFPPDCAVWLDVSEFEHLLDAGLQDANTSTARSLLERALLLYTNDYLAEDREATWALAERTRLRECYFAGATRLMQ
jgi:two-component SAPR family response regulator